MSIKEKSEWKQEKEKKEIKRKEREIERKVKRWKGKNIV